MTIVVPVLVFIIGLCIGSFVNVLVFRLPESQSVVRPRSRCRGCGKTLSWYENIPLVSFLVQGGRCRGCRASISIQYPLVELGVGALFVGNFLLLGARGASSAPEQVAALGRPEWIVGALFTTILLAIALTDLRTYIIPDELSLGGLALGLALSFLPGEPPPLEAFLGAVVGGGLLLVVAWLGALVFKKDAMGGGDVKMLAMIGAFVGLQGVFLTLFLGALLGTLLYGPVAVLERLRRRSVPAVDQQDGALAEATTGEGPGPDLLEEASGASDDLDRSLVPFGFFLAPAGALTFYLADEIVQGYLRLVGFQG